MRKVDDKENSVFKHDRFLMSFQVFRSYTATIMCTRHCVKCVEIRSYFRSIYPCIQSEYRKIRTGNNSVFGHFSRSAWEQCSPKPMWWQQGGYIVFMITYILCPSCFCEIWALCMSWITYNHLSYFPCLACWALFGSLVPAMCNRISCAQVHKLPQNHSGDNWQSTLIFWLRI